MTIVAKPLPVSLGFDTSENMNAQQYAFLASKGYQWGCRYVPLSGQSPTSYGVIQKSELEVALAAKFGMMFVQFARNSGWSVSVGLADGKAAAQYLLSLGVPNNVCLWADLGVTPTAQVAIDYMNAWYEGTIEGGMLASAAGVYMEPGVPLNASDRYNKLHLHRYWATAANDPNKIPSNRGCQLLQAWGSKQGQYFPEPGLVIDGDFAQMDYFGDVPIAAFGA
jgi:hypothetical protein